MDQKHELKQSHSNVKYGPHGEIYTMLFYTLKDWSIQYLDNDLHENLI